MAHRSVVPCVLALAALALPATAQAAVPTATFADPGVVVIGDRTALDASGSSDPDGGFIYKYEWDVDGDANPFDDAAVITTYDPGFAIAPSATGVDVPIFLRVTDNDGERSAPFARPLDITHAPTAAIRVHGERPYAPNQPLYFSADVADADGEATTVEWDLDFDGTTGETVLPNLDEVPTFADGLVFRRFAAERVYTVRVTVSDTNGASTTVSRPITIGNPDLAARLSAGTIIVEGADITGRSAAAAATIAAPRVAAGARTARTVRAAAPLVAATVATRSGATVTVQTVPGARATVTAHLGAKAVGRGTAVANSRGVARVKIRLTKAGRTAVRKGRKLTLKGSAAGRSLRTSVRVE
jgi:hypothetical protein